MTPDGLEFCAKALFNMRHKGIGDGAAAIWPTMADEVKAHWRERAEHPLQGFAFEIIGDDTRRTAFDPGVEDLIRGLDQMMVIKTLSAESGELFKAWWRSL